MMNEIKDRIFSFSGVSICVGAVGFLSGIVTIFIDVYADISVKWLLLSILLSIIVMLLLLKTVYDLTTLVSQRLTE